MTLQSKLQIQNSINFLLRVKTLKRINLVCIRVYLLLFKNNNNTEMNEVWLQKKLT